MRRALLVLIAALGVPAASFVGTRQWLGSRARAQAGDAGASLRSCLLGGGLAPGERPSTRYRRVELARPESDWPARCRPLARALDEALAAPWLGMPSPLDETAESCLDAPRELRGTQLDALFAALERTGLPRPESSEHATLPAPPPSKPLLSADKLEALLERALALEAIAVDAAGDSEARLLVGAGENARPQLCTIATSVLAGSCRDLPREIGRAGLRLARAEGDAPALVVGEGGLYDAVSGQRIERSRRSDAQVAVHADGTVELLDADGEDASALRVVRFVPGRAPQASRAAVAAGQFAELFPQALVWWSATRGDVSVQRSGGRTEVAGHLPAQARTVASCARADEIAILTSSPTGAALVHVAARRASVAHLGEGARFTVAPSLACEPEGVYVAALDGADAVSSHCGRQGCTTPSHDSFEPADLQAAGIIAGDIVLVQLRRGLGVRLRSARPGALGEARERVLLDERAFGGLDVVDLRLVPVGDAALILLRDADGRLFALRWRSGELLPIRPLVVQASQG